MKERGSIPNFSKISAEPQHFLIFNALKDKKGVKKPNL